MRSQRVFLLSLGLLLAASWAGGDAAHAQQFMSLREAITRFLPAGSKPFKVQKTIPDDKLPEMRKRFELRDDAQMKEKLAKGPYTFFVGRDAAEKATVYIVVLTQTWGTCFHKYAVAISPDGKLREIVVVELNCPYANPINRKSFLGQFEGKRTADARDHVRLGDDIDAVTGATASSDVTTIVTRRALALFELFFTDE